MRVLISTLRFLVLSKIFPLAFGGWGVARSQSNRVFSPFSKYGRSLIERINRGGGTDEDDEERYSRQVYTLGARAHGMVRSATVYVDGPSESGLMYECIKNLALSGVGNIVVVTSEKNEDSNYHNKELDDLGQTYIRGARAELGVEKEDTTKPDEIVVEFLHRLNPSLQIDTITRDELQQKILGSFNDILLCVDRPYDTQIELNELSRKQCLSFVAVETAGLYGRTFCDFGPKFEIHDVDGETPLVIPLDGVTILNEEEKTIQARCLSGERHDVSKGDKVQFQLHNEEVLDVTWTIAQVHSPELVTIKLDSDDFALKDLISKINTEARSFTRLKQLEEVSFLPLQQAVADSMQDSSLFNPCDLDKSFDSTRRHAVFSSFQALNKFVKLNESLPSTNDWKSFLDTAKVAWDDNNQDFSKEWRGHCKSFLKTCSAKFVPLQAIFGALASQECLKAASGLYNPIRQFLLYDCDEVAPSPGGEKEVCYSSGQAYIFGEQINKAFQDQNLFVVGAGAIGCEVLKNLAAMGAGSGIKGSVIVTDMDTIERSNLSRQLLFRDTDIGKFKSKAAQEAIFRLNPRLKLECHTSKVGEGEDSGPFDCKFWSKKVDVVLNALDNVEARLFMDGQCITNEKTLVDAGTLGPKGNIQVVVPHQSESYGSSADPPELAIPVCTLKNFPYMISHTIQWGRDLFDGLFVRRPKQANQYAEVLIKEGLDSLGNQLESDLGDQAAIDAARELSQDLSLSSVNDIIETRKNSIDWAIRLANELFHDAIRKLLTQHPADSLDEEGEPFWSGSRKTPKALLFLDQSESDSQQSIINKNIIDFVRYTARLRIETILGESITSGDSILSVDEIDAALKVYYNSSDTTNRQEDDSAYSQIRDFLEPLSSFSGSNFAQNIAEFEKDDESNGHIAFIAAASNLRAICYGIAPVDAMETRRVAGKIVPAMITTTAFVSALSCIELLKAVQDLPLLRYRNAFINLALPFFAFTAPLPAEEFQGLQGKTYTLWDRLTIKEGKKTAAKGGITLRNFLKRLKQKVCDDPEIVDVSTISFGQFMIYASFLHEGDDELLDTNLVDAVEKAVESGNEFDNMYSRDSRDSAESTDPAIGAAESIDFTVVVADMETGEEVELPPVRLLRSKK